LFSQTDLVVFVVERDIDLQVS